MVSIMIQSTLVVHNSFPLSCQLMLNRAPEYDYYMIQMAVVFYIDFVQYHGLTRSATSFLTGAKMIYFSPGNFSTGVMGPICPD